jgi:hypothetical protein
MENGIFGNKLTKTGMGIIAFLAMPAAAAAQAYEPVAVNAGPHGAGVVLPDIGGIGFFVVIIVGVILALGFQAVLTAFSCAMGLSLTPNLMKAEASRKVKRLAAETEEDELSEDHATGKTGIINGLGTWALVTTSVALFAASWLAVRLAVVPPPEDGVILALAIWASFFLLVSYLEWQGVRSLIGGVMSIASSNLYSGIDFLRGLSFRSEAGKIEAYGRKTARGIYQELSELAQKDRLDKKLSKYLLQLKPSGLDFDKIHDEIVDLLNQLRIEQNAEIHEDQVARIFSVHLEKDHKYLNRDNIAKLTQTVKKAARTARDGKGPIEKAVVMAKDGLSLSTEEVQALEQRFRDFLEAAKRSAVDPDSLRADIEDIIQHPEAAVDIIRARLSHFDRDTLKALIAQSGLIDNAKIDAFVEDVIDVVDSLKSEYEETAGAARKAVAVLTAAVPHTIEQKLASYFASLDRPELNYEAIKMDVEDIMNDPKAAPAIVKNRLSQIDKDTLIALIRSNPWINPEQSNILADQIGESFEKVTENISLLQTKALSQYERVRYQAILAAEHARENAIAAAWWVVSTAVLSGGAAALGGYVATRYI